MNIRVTFRRTMTVIIATVLLAACGSSAVPSPSMAASGQPVSASPTGSPPSTPSPSPSEIPSATAPPSGWSRLIWSEPVVSRTQDAIRMEDIAAWGQGYVGVGETGVADPELNPKGAFLTSPDALHWTVAQTVVLHRTDEVMTHVFLVGGGLLATAEGGGVDCPTGTACPTPDFSPDLWRSTDGAHWTPVDSPSWHAGWSDAGAPQWMVAGDAGIIAIGYEGRGVGQPGQPSPPAVPLVLHSRDGTAWAQANLTRGFDHAVFRGAVAFPGRFVIVGRDGVRNPTTEVPDPDRPLSLGMGRPAAWVSSDGINWTRAQVEGVEIKGGELSAVEAGADGLFAIGAGSPSAGDATPTGWSSADGATWNVVGPLRTQLPAIDQARLPGSTILASDGRRIVVLNRVAPGSERMAVWMSTDGAAWDRLALAGSTSLPKIGYYEPHGAQGMYATGATVLADRIVVFGRGNATSALWLATAASP